MIGDERACWRVHPALGDIRCCAPIARRASRRRCCSPRTRRNTERLFGAANPSPYVKDAFHEYVVHGRDDAREPRRRRHQGRRRCYRAAGARRRRRSGRRAAADRGRAGDRRGLRRTSTDFDDVFAQRQREADAFYGDALADRRPRPTSATSRARRYAGLLWTKQFYHYVVHDWLEGDPGQPPPPAARRRGRNRDWRHLFNRDIISMPDKWEYPWYAAWDLAFHMIPMAPRRSGLRQGAARCCSCANGTCTPTARCRPTSSRFGDVNPPVHAWACWRVYKMTRAARRARSRLSGSACFRSCCSTSPGGSTARTPTASNLFAGGFLGLDNIGVFDRSQAAARPAATSSRPTARRGWRSTAPTMLSMALELAEDDPAYEDIASKFFEHFVAIADAMNTLGGTGLWDEAGRLLLRPAARERHVRRRCASARWSASFRCSRCEVLEDEVIDRLPGFASACSGSSRTGPISAAHIASPADETAPATRGTPAGHPVARAAGARAALRAGRDRVPVAVRHPLAVAGASATRPTASCSCTAQELRVDYAPGEVDTGTVRRQLQLARAGLVPGQLPADRGAGALPPLLRRRRCTVECPHRLGHSADTWSEVARRARRRLTALFLPDDGGRAALPRRRRGATPTIRTGAICVLFHEYFHGDTGRGAGASHQTGWTALVIRFLEDRERDGHGKGKPR